MPLSDNLSAWFFFKQRTSYELRISDWSSDVCSSDLSSAGFGRRSGGGSGHELRRTGRWQHKPAGAAGPYRAAARRCISRGNENGRAACRERVGQCVYISVVAGALTKKRVRKSQQLIKRPYTNHTQRTIAQEAT